VYAAGAQGASLLVSDVLVVAQGTGSGSHRWVTLAVKPTAVEQIIATTQKASLYLTLPSQTEGGSNDD
jgi:hypothetical protein